MLQYRGFSPGTLVSSIHQNRLGYGTLYSLTTSRVIKYDMTRLISSKQGNNCTYTLFCLQGRTFVIIFVYFFEYILLRKAKKER